MKIVIINIDNLDKDKEDNIRKGGLFQDRVIEENRERKIEVIMNHTSMITMIEKKETMRGKI